MANMAVLHGEKGLELCAQSSCLHLQSSVLILGSPVKKTNELEDVQRRVTSRVKDLETKPCKEQIEVSGCFVFFILEKGSGMMAIFKYLKSRRVEIGRNLFLAAPSDISDQALGGHPGGGCSGLGFSCICSWMGLLPAVQLGWPSVFLCRRSHFSCREKMAGEEMAEEVQKKIQGELEKFQQLQKEINKCMTAQQKLEAQLTENNVVKELDLLDSSNTVYKLIGPVLVKQDMDEAKATVGKRLDYITGEM
ncbi:uncharacterized protein LOC110071373 [Pogona vitticeps]